MKLKAILFSLIMMVSSNLWAAKGGSSIGGFFGTAGASQTDINSVITTTSSGAGRLTSGLEFAGFWQYRFSGMLALQFRGSYLSQSESNGSNKYALSGFTLFPMMRLYLL